MYYNTESPMDYFLYLLRKQINFKIIEDIPIEDSDRSTLEAILPLVLARKERHRWKAEFRDEEMMKQRLEFDIRCALYAARIHPSASIPDAQAYLVSLDKAFSFIQSLAQWSHRPRIHLPTTDLPRLAEYALGVHLHNDEIVRIIFNPIHIAATEQIKASIQDLAEIGVNLREVSLNRLEWDITHDLRNKLLENRRIQATQETSEEERLASVIALSQNAQYLGYTLDPEMRVIVESYYTLKQALEQEQKRRARAEEIAGRLINAASGLSKKGKRRVGQILHDIGGFPENIEDPIQ